LKTLLQNPRISDREIARICGLSQPTVTRRRQELQNEGLIRFVTVPDLSKLGFGIIAFSLLDLKHEIPVNPAIMWAKEDVLSHQILLVSAHQDFEKFIEFKRTYKVVTLALCFTHGEPHKPLSFGNFF